ncbi:MAG: hypothetical protein GY786_15230, partial [Proteobacteria bacterium]|nr:hypothetical protein [Pseudomonadota bacterium]
MQSICATLSGFSARAIVLFTLSIQLATADPVDQTSPLIKQTSPPENLLILELFLKRIFLDDAFVAYEKKGEIYIPLASFFSRLNFPIKVDVQNGTARGWFIEEVQTFNLNLNNNEIVIGEQASQINRDEIHWTEEEILVSTTLLKRWFPFEYHYNSLNQSLKLQSSVLIPLEERIEREAKQKELADRKDVNLDSNVSYKQAEYTLFSVPNTSLRLATTLNNSEQGGNVTLSTLSKGDLLYSTMNLFTGFNTTNGLTTLRFSVGKKDRQVELFGSLRASEYEVGDVATPGTDMINNANSGFGFRVNNYPLSSSRNIGYLPITGRLEPNWEVELYHNGLLIDFTNTAGDGSYEFQEAPLRSGLNIFEIKFYGPSGEKKNRIIRHYFSSDLNAEDRLFYRIALSQHGQSLYNSDIKNQKLQSDSAAGKIHQIFDLDYGLSKTLTLKFGHVNTP